MAKRKGSDDDRWAWSWRDLDRVAVGAILGGVAVWWWTTRERTAATLAANEAYAQRLAAAQGRPLG
jgi:hypothetical protein